jgi:phage gp16-like protein
MEQLALPNQIIKIKIAQKQLNIDEDTKLQQYASYGVTSCKELSEEQADSLIEAYIRAGFKVVSKKQNENPNWGSRKYSDLDKRGYPYAKSSKLRMIEAMWKDVSYSKTDESLQTFIKNKVGVDHITFLEDYHANKIITALQYMKVKQNEKKSSSINAGVKR